MIRAPLAPPAVAALLGAAATIIPTEMFALPAAVPTWQPRAPHSPVATGA